MYLKVQKCTQLYNRTSKALSNCEQGLAQGSYTVTASREAQTVLSMLQADH